MRTVFIGAGEVSIETAKALVKKGHEVIIIETDKAKIDELSEEMDCSFLQGDGSRPDILREVNPEQTDFLFCLTDSDQANVIASLVGRSLGFKRVVTSIRDEQFEVICHELGLKDTIIPSRTISRYLEDMVGGSKNVELSTVLKVFHVHRQGRRRCRRQRAKAACGCPRRLLLSGRQIRPCR
jgi:trk system potassium uptake protein TrkA